MQKVLRAGDLVRLRGGPKSNYFLVTCTYKKTVTWSVGMGRPVTRDEDVFMGLSEDGIVKEYKQDGFEVLASTSSP